MYNTKRTTAYFVILCLIISFFGLTLMACEKKIEQDITISFQTFGGTVVESKIYNPDNFQFPDDPTYDGMLFDGWYYDKTIINKVVENDFSPDSSITLYASWVTAHSLSYFDSPILTYIYYDPLTNNPINFAKYNQTVHLAIYATAGYSLVSDSLIVESEGGLSIQTTIIYEKIDELIISILIPDDSVKASISTSNRSYNFQTTIQGGNADIYLTHQNQIQFGEEVSFVVYPSSGFYYVNAILKDTYSEIVVENNTFIMPASNCSLIINLLPLAPNALVQIETSIVGEGSVILSNETPITGEFVGISALPGDGYYLDSISLNGSVISSHFSIPGDIQIAKLDVVFAPVNKNLLYTISCLPGTHGSVSVSKVRFYPGESVEFIANPHDSYQLDSIFYDGNFYSPFNFIMPKADVLLTPIFTPIKHAITIDYSIAHMVSLNTYNAHSGEIVFINVTAEPGTQLKTLCINNLVLTTLEFEMPNQTVNITAAFESFPIDPDTLYPIFHYNEFVTGGMVSLIADKNYAKAGDIINVQLDYSGNLNILSINYHTSTVNESIIGYTFIMPASDVELRVSFSQSPDIHEYSVSIDADASVIISTEQSTYLKSSAVSIHISDEYKTKISAIFYYDSNTKTTLPLVFNMPAFDIILHVELKESEPVVEQINLYNFYINSNSNFFNNGLISNYYDKYNDIESYLNNRNLTHFKGKISQILSFSGLGSDFIVYKTINPETSIKLSQSIYLKNLSPSYSIGAYGNFVVQSSATDFSNILMMLNHGIEQLNDFILFKDGPLTYVIYAYIGNNSIISIPSVFNGIAITKILAGAFNFDNNITSLNLTNIQELENGALNNLAHISKIDLSNIQTMSDDALKFCMSLNYIHVDTRNKYYASFDGILYLKSQLKILRYPPKKSGNSFTANTTQQRFASIGDYAFYGAQALTLISLDGISSIGDYAFKDCTSLKGSLTGQLSLPSLVILGAYAFQNCPQIVKFIMPRLRSIGDFAFLAGTNTLTLEITNLVLDLDVVPIQFTESTYENITILTTFDSLDNLRQSKTWILFKDRFRLAQLDQNKALLMFESDGSYVNSIANLNLLTTLPTLQIPRKEGFAFVGWYVDKDRTIPVDYNTAIISYVDSDNVLILYSLFVINN